MFGRDLEGPKRVSIEMTSTRNGLPFGMAAEQPPKAPLAHPPRAPEAHKALLPNVPLIPTTAGPLAQQLPRALFPKGTREARLKFYMCTMFGKQGVQKRPIVVTFSKSKGTQKRASEYHLSRARLQAPSKGIKPFARVSLNKFFLSLFKTSVG